eukprot:gene41868-55548_t
MSLSGTCPGNRYEGRRGVVLVARVGGCPIRCRPWRSRR